MNRIRVNLDRRLSASYDIHIGRGILDRMALILAKGNWAGRWFVVTDETVAGLRSRRIAFNTEAVDITDAESAGRWRELLAGADDLFHHLIGQVHLIRAGGG